MANPSHPILLGISLVIWAMMPVSSIQDFWRAMDPHYDLTYLEPVEETFAYTVIGCALHSLRMDVTAFGYLESHQRCHLYYVDYYVKHIWPPEPGLQFFLRNEEIIPGSCHASCGFCMTVVESLTTWSEADTACRLLNSRLLEMTSAWMHRCVVMELQYFRKPTSNRYWLGGEYSPSINDWKWIRYNNLAGTPDHLWASGEPDNPGTEGCVLLVPGGNYTMRSADCSEKHFALCAQWLGGS